MERVIASSCTGHSFTLGAETTSLARGVKDPAANLSFSNRNLSLLSSGTGFWPVSGASASTWRHKSGDGRLTTHSGRLSRFFKVLVSLSRPRVIVHPNAQKEEIGARFGVPSSLIELINATGFPK